MERINSDLANPLLATLVNRTISGRSNKYFGGVVEDRGAAEAVDEGSQVRCDRHLCKDLRENGGAACG